jgi:hypothetical protein
LAAATAEDTSERRGLPRLARISSTESRNHIHEALAPNFSRTNLEIHRWQVSLEIELPEFIDKVVKMVRPSPSEVVRCLNIDYFEY